MISLDEPCTAVVRLLTDEFQANVKQLESLTEAACSKLHLRQFQVNVDLVDDDQIRDLNQRFRQIDKATDVLSFPLLNWQTPASSGKAVAAPKDPSPEPILGDIAISLPTAEKNAREIGQGLDREVCFLMVHGLLHLCGHDHMEEHDEALMVSEQRNLMEEFCKGPTPAWTGVVSRVGGYHG